MKPSEISDTNLHIAFPEDPRWKAPSEPGDSLIQRYLITAANMHDVLITGEAISELLWQKAETRVNFTHKRPQLLHTEARQHTGESGEGTLRTVLMRRIVTDNQTHTERDVWLERWVQTDYGRRALRVRVARTRSVFLLHEGDVEAKFQMSFGHLDAATLWTLTGIVQQAPKTRSARQSTTWRPRGTPGGTELTWEARQHEGHNDHCGMLHVHLPELRADDTDERIMEAATMRFEERTLELGEMLQQARDDIKKALANVPPSTRRRRGSGGTPGDDEWPEPGQSIRA